MTVYMVHTVAGPAGSHWELHASAGAGGVGHTTRAHERVEHIRLRERKVHVWQGCEGCSEAL